MNEQDHREAIAKSADAIRGLTIALNHARSIKDEETAAKCERQIKWFEGERDTALAALNGRKNDAGTADR
jgi:hypothetical protein